MNKRYIKLKNCSVEGSSTTDFFIQISVVGYVLVHHLTVKRTYLICVEIAKDTYISLFILLS